MNEIHRRTALSALGLTAFAAAAKAGPLNPPAGAVAPTGRTNDEIYNKIPGVGGFDGRMPIAGGSTGITISTPGSYVLTGNLATPGTAINIGVSNVTLDLNGYQLSTASLSAVVLGFSASVGGISIRNGTLRGGSVGLASSSANTQVLLEDLAVIDARLNGISISSTTCRDWTVRRCRVMGTGSTTTASDGALFIAGILYTGSSGVFEDCTVSRLVYNGSGTGTLRAISINSTTGTGNVVSGCRMINDTAITGTGLFTVGSGIYRDNTVANLTIPYSVAAGWVNGGGNV
jgi:hypothetical protein